MPHDVKRIARHFPIPNVNPTVAVPADIKDNAPLGIKVSQLGKKLAEWAEAEHYPKALLVAADALEPKHIARSRVFGGAMMNGSLVLRERERCLVSTTSSSDLGLAPTLPARSLPRPRA